MKLNKTHTEETNNVKKEILKSNEREEYSCFLGTFNTKLIWVNIVAIFILHVASVIVIVTYPWTTKLRLVAYGK